jgi:hypothetical protein
LIKALLALDVNGSCSACSAVTSLSMQQQGRELPGEASEADLAVVQQMRALIISGQPFTERKSTFQVRLR